MRNKTFRMHWFSRSEDGNVTIFSVFMLVLILMITGASVDIMRFESTRTRMQSSMDRAVLAAADLDQEQDPAAVVADYLDKAGMQEALSDVQIANSVNARTVSANGSVDLDTIFMHMSGWDTLTAPALSVADERIANVEISMVLDISGSMRYNDRITKMKPAAQHFVNKVMSEDSNGVTTLNVIPFAGHVNPGDTLFDYFRGERPKIKGNNGWGNGDQDAPGGSLCNNNAENADEGAADPSCSDGYTPTTTADDSSDTTTDPTAPAEENFFPAWNKAISNIVMYFDTDGDDIYDVAHKIEGFPDNAPRDADEFYKGAVAYAMAQDLDLNDPEQFLGISIKGGHNKHTKYFQVKGDENGDWSDLGPTKNKGKIPGDTFQYGSINFTAWAEDYVSPNPEILPETANDGAEENQQEDVETNVNMPGSCIEIYQDEFTTTAMPQSFDYVPHFMFWEIAADVMDWGWCPDEDTAIQYYSDDKDHLIDFIGGMRMHDGTGLQYGMKYALSLLDPANRDEVSHLISEGIVDSRFEGRPIDWNDSETEKYVVLMTDGQTTDQYRPKKPDAAINGEVELQFQGSNHYINFTNKSTNISNLMQQCDLAKELGVTVFTIAFETNSAATADMRNCASSVSHFFHVQGDEIYDAFDMVARQINNLRLIQ